MPRQRSSLRDLENAEEPADTIPAPRARRSRRWERRQRNDPEVAQVTYRGIPRDLHDQLKDLAREHRVTVSEIARLFLEYAWEAYEAGDLEIRTRPADQKLTVDFGANSDVPGE